MPMQQFELFDQEPAHGDSLLEEKSASQNPDRDPRPVSGSNYYDPSPSSIKRANALREMSKQLKFKNKHE